MYIIEPMKIKGKKKNVRKGFMRASKVVRNLRMYIFYRVAGPAFQAVTLFWK